MIFYKNYIYRDNYKDPSKVIIIFIFKDLIIL